jgi:hypothetical protein
MRHLAPHLRARLGRHALADRVTGPPQQPPDERHRPELREARPGPRVGIEKPLHIGVGEPQLGQRLQIVARMDRLGQKHRVDAPRACPGHDIREHAESQVVAFLDALEQFAVYRAHLALRRRSAVKIPARAGEMPHLLRDAMHVDRKADAAVAD